MKPSCLTCSDSSNKTLYNNNNIISKTKNIVPFWYKEIGNYSHLPPPLNCDSKYNRFKHKFTTQSVKGNPKLSVHLDVSKIIDVDFPVWIYFWAAKKRNYNSIKYPYAIQGYEQFQNSGLIKTDENGKATLHLHNPELYQVKTKVYAPHIHFTYLKPDKTWEIEAYTISLVPKLSLSTFKKLLHNPKYIVVNSIPLENNPDLIDGTYLLPFNSNIDIDIFFEKIRSKKKNLNESSLKTKELPIIIYCQNSKCDASNQLIKRLRQLGYVNLMYFPGGIDAYRKNESKSK